MSEAARLTPPLPDDEVSDKLDQILECFISLDCHMTRLGQSRLGASVSRPHDMITTAWVAARELKEMHDRFHKS